MKTYYGIYQGVVSNIQDPEERGRIKCVIPDVIGAKVESAWCDPCVTVAYDNGGDFCIPKINETVWIMFKEGNPNKPVYLGGWWRKNSVPKETYDELDNYRIISYADCKIVLVNGKIHIETSDNSIVEMQEGKITLETSDGDTEVTIEDKKVTIKGDLYVEGNIHGSKSAYLKENVEADIDVRARNNVDANNSVNSPQGNLNIVNSDTVYGTDVYSQLVDSNTLRGDITDLGDVTALSANIGGINFNSHIHSGTVYVEGQAQNFDTTEPR